MAVLDSSLTQTSHGAAYLTIADGGANTITLKFEGSFSWEETGRSVTEALNRGRHLSTPNVIETGDNNVAVTLDGLITSYLGSSNTHVYEAMKFTGTASSWASTTDGSAKCFRLTYTTIEPNSTTTQTLTFAYCHLDTISIDPRGDDGKTSFSASITDYENQPTVA